MKKTINKTAFVSKPVAAAVGLAMGALVAANASAVNVSTTGIGDVLMFPYYTVNNGYNTNINITNTSGDTVAFKIRFRESENSRDARDFNVILSPYDVWNGSVVKNEEGYARLVTADTSCTVGKLTPLEGTNQSYVDFTNFDFVDGSLKNADGGSAALTRTNEGHVEVIAMGRINHTVETDPSYVALPTIDPKLAATAAAQFAYNAKHVDGTPRNCDAVRAAFGVDQDSATALKTIVDLRAGFIPAGNVLKGSVSFLNVNAGKAITSEPTVLANFNEGTTSSDSLVVLPGSQAPGLHDTSSTNGLADVNAVISRNAIINQYSVNPAVNGQTDWVVTFPTKHYHVDERNAFSTDFATVNDGAYYTKPTWRVIPMAKDAGGNVTRAGVAVPPFTETFQSGTAACASVGVDFKVYDREENTPAGKTPGFSPAEPDETNSICHEVQVITFNETDLFGSPNSKSVDVGAYRNGWMELTFKTPTLSADQEAIYRATSVAVDGATLSNGDKVDSVSTTWTYTGYPVIGFSATTLENGVAADAMLNYGFSANHAYK